MSRYMCVEEGLGERWVMRAQGITLSHEEDGEAQEGRGRVLPSWIRRRCMGISIGATGWALLLFYLVYEYEEYGSLAGLLAHVGNPNPIPMAFHVMVFLAPAISMFFGYLTEKKMALEHEVRGAKGLVHSIINGSADAIVTTAKDGTITTWNKGAEELYGYRAEEVLGRPVNGIYPEELKAERRKWQRAIADGRTLRNIPARIYNKKGELVEISLSLSPLKDESGAVIGAVGVSKEVTEHRRMEEEIAAEKIKLESIVSGIGAGLSLLDSEAKVVWANEVLQDWFGPLENIRGRRCYELCNVKDPERECAALRTLRSGQVEHCETFAKDRNGVGRYFQLTTAPIKDKAGKTVQIVELTQDITERKEAEKALREKMEELERWQKHTVGREVRMAELKKRIRELEAEVERLKKKRGR
ncbi:MAG: PAS domain S-box protein [Methanobacteriota archaeon]|nr:MAG: PAS domain S-box protein [Euryarchaeota archaeon]